MRTHIVLSFVLLFFFLPLERAIKLQSDLADAWNNLGVLQREEGDMEVMLINIYYKIKKLRKFMLVLLKYDIVFLLIFFCNNFRER